MADRLNTLGFVSWGLLGYGESVTGGDANLDVSLTQSENLAVSLSQFGIFSTIVYLWLELIRGLKA